MPRHVAVVFVHGIFAEGFSYAEPMRTALLQRLPRELQHYVRFESVFWAHQVRGHQRNFMQNVRAHTDVVDNHLRRFLIEGLGDAAAYQKTKHRENSMYYDVHASIGNVLDRIDTPGRADQPVIFIGHSLGCHIISSFVWTSTSSSSDRPPAFNRSPTAPFGKNGRNCKPQARFVASTPSPGS